MTLRSSYRNLRSALRAAFLALLSPAVLAAQVSQQRPNFLFILADDLGQHQLGCYGSKYYETPNIDRLAAEGMKFTRAYSAAPICSPTRASLMTGKYPARLRVTDFIPGSTNWRNTQLLVPDWNKALPTSEVTLAEMLREAGYLSGHFGKWHLNIDRKNYLDRPGDPQSQGFDDVLTTYKPNEETNQNPDPKDDPHNVRRITDRAIAFLEKNKDRPFFCYVSHNSIHRPEMDHPDRISKYEKKAGADNRDNRPVLAAMLEALDSSVGRLMAKVNDLGLAERTVVIFFGDNGMFGDPETLKPLRGAKGHLYEAGIREPLIVRWPGKIKASSVCDVPIISNDFYPTLAQLAGQKLDQPDLDGISFVPLLRQIGAVSRGALYFHYPHYSPQGGRPGGAVVAGQYKLVVWYEKEVEAKNPLDAVELYDLEKDIGEQHNLARLAPTKAQALYQKFKHWQRTVGAQQMKRNPDYNPALPTTERSD